MKNISSTVVLLTCALGSAYFSGCSSDASSDDNQSTAGSGGEGGSDTNQAGATSHAGSNSGGTAGNNSGGAGAANGGASNGGSSGESGAGGEGGGAGGTNSAGNGGADNAGSGGTSTGGTGGTQSQGGGGTGGEGGAAGAGGQPELSVACSMYCQGAGSILTKCSSFNYFNGSESTCLGQCVANQDGPWDMTCRLMHLANAATNDAVHCPHAFGANTCQ